MSNRPYDHRLFEDVFEIVNDALAEHELGVPYSELNGAVLDHMKTRLTSVFDRIYDDAYHAGRADGWQDDKP